jgi:hypothetical protein
MIAFIARGVAATELPDLNSRVVVLAEAPDGDGGPVLEISCALEPTAQDRALGQDTYCLSIQSGATIYGGVAFYSLEGNTLTMRLEPIAQETLDIPAEFSIVLDVDSATIESVRVALTTILGRSGGAS